MTELQHASAVHDTAQSLLELATKQGDQIASDAIMLALAEGIAQASEDQYAIRKTVSKMAAHVFQLASSIHAEMIDEAEQETARAPKM